MASIDTTHEKIDASVVVPSSSPSDSLSSSSGSPWSFLTSNALVASGLNALQSIQARRDALGLPCPGSVDRVAKEVESDVLLNNYSFTGLRADLTKTFSAGAPLFQVSHSLSSGSQVSPPYAFAVIYGTNRVFMQANIDNDKAVMARFNWRWSNALVTKTMAQFQPDANGQTMVSVENDYTGSDFTASVKALNPSILEGGFTGMVTGEYLQSITKRLSLGLSALWQRQAMNQGPEMLLTYAARYKTPEWIASAQFVSMGMLQASYWRKIADKVEGGVSAQLSYMQPPGGAMMGGPRAEGTAAVGLKYDFRMSQFKAQVDSNGRVACYLEKRVAPMVAVAFVGQLDHVKKESKLGLSISIDAMGEEVAIQQEQMQANGEIPNIPA